MGINKQIDKRVKMHSIITFSEIAQGILMKILDNSIKNGTYDHPNTIIIKNNYCIIFFTVIIKK